MRFQGAYTPYEIDITGRPWLAPKPCGALGNTECHNTPTRPYPAGWRCDDHQPSTPDFTGAFIMVTGRAFDGSVIER